MELFFMILLTFSKISIYLTNTFSSFIKNRDTYIVDEIHVLHFQ